MMSPRLHRLACFCQQLGAVAVQRGKAIAVVDHRIGSDVFVGNEDIRSFSLASSASNSFGWTTRTYQQPCSSFLISMTYHFQSSLLS